MLQTTSTFRFADIEVREPELRVIRSGESLAIEPKAFRVLIYLLRHAGRLVPKEELLTAVWGDTAVTDNSLTRAVALLRRMLDDDPHQPRFIETVSTAGYRFICPVDTGSAADAASRSTSIHLAETPAAEPRAETRRFRRKLWIELAATGVVLAGAAGLTWYALRPLPMLRVASYTEIASVGQPNVMAGTDGSSLYLDLARPNGTGVVPISGGRVTPLSIDLPTSKDSPNNSPIIGYVSPDGSKFIVGGNVDPSSGRKLWIVDAHGGGASYLAQGQGAIWSPDGRTVVYSTIHGDLYTVPSEGGEPRLLLASPAQPGAPLAVNSLTWSPDESRIRFVRNQRYWEISADGKNPHEILPNWHAAKPKYYMCCGDWTPDGDFFVFVAGTGGVPHDLAAASQLWVVDERRSWLHRANPEPVELTNGAIIWGSFVFSRDGKTVYCSGGTRKGELVKYDSKSKQLVPYLGGISAEYVNFSRDGKYLVYVAYPDGTMWRANRDGSGLQQLTGPPFYPVTPEWSPDGTQIVFSTLTPSHPGEMYTISSQGGVPMRLLPDDMVRDVIPDWSPDGKKVVFVQNQAGAGFGMYHGEKTLILDLDTGKVTDFPPCPKPCYSPRWSPDGRTILELAVDHKNMMLLDLKTNHWSQLDPKLGAIDFPRWSRDGRSIYFEDADLGSSLRSTDPGVYRVPVTGGKAEKVVDMKGFRGAGSLGVGWSDLDPDDTPLLLRDVGTYDIYALALERK